MMLNRENFQQYFLGRSDSLFVDHLVRLILDIHKILSFFSFGHSFRLSLIIHLNFFQSALHSNFRLNLYSIGYSFMQTIYKVGLHSFRLSLIVPYVVFKLSFDLSVIHSDFLWSSVQTFFFVGPLIRFSLVVHWKFLSFIG